jgi:hypothetical protein
MAKVLSIKGQSVTRKKLYEQAIEDSAVSWCNLYQEEKSKRQELEKRYNLLVHQLKKEGTKRALKEADAFLASYAKEWDRL